MIFGYFFYVIRKNVILETHGGMALVNRNQVH